MKYYLLRQDVAVQDKWVLGDLRHVNNWMIIDPPANFMEPGEYVLDVRFEGREVDYSLAGYASAPVISEKARKSLLGLPEVDEPYRNVVLEPIRIEGVGTSSDYSIMIIETQVDCVDEAKSRFECYRSDDVVRPDLAGNYRGFYNLVLDHSKIGSAHIFRLKKYLGAIIVSEEVKFRFEQAGVRGAVFDSVNGDAITVA